MNDFITLILTHATAADEAALRDAVAHHADALRAAGRGDAAAVRRAEDAVRLNPAAAFSYAADGSAMLRAAGATWAAGRFETDPLPEIRSR